MKEEKRHIMFEDENGATMITPELDTVDLVKTHITLGGKIMKKNGKFINTPVLHVDLEATQRLLRRRLELILRQNGKKTE